MGRVRRALSGFAALFRKQRLERELDAELRAYLDASTADKIAAGWNPREAARAARAEMGSLQAVKEKTLAIGWQTHLETLWRDIRYALRTLRRSPGFAVTALSTLALGIGATAAMFSLLDAVMLRSLPVRHPEQLVLVGGAQYPVYQAFRQQTDIFVDLLATSGITPLDVDVQGGASERTAVSLVSDSYFSTLGVQASIGHTFANGGESRPGESAVAVLSHAYWERRFGRDSAVLDRIIRINGRPLTIIGVAPQGFFGEAVGAAPDMWVPLTMWAELVPGRNLLESPATGWLRLIGRVQPGVAVTGVHPKLTDTFRQVLTDVFGPIVPVDVQRDLARAAIKMEPAATGLSTLRTRFARPLQLMMGAVAVVLLIACANIANLLLVRASGRRREIDVRVALGVTRARLLRQLLTESIVLAGMGGALGIGVASAAREAVLRLISADGSRVPLAVTTDARMLLFVAATASATAVLFGLAPAWQAARAQVGSSLGPRREIGSRSRQRLGSALVVGQVALSLVLLTGAGLFLRTIANLRQTDLGLAADRLLVVDVNMNAAATRVDRAIGVARPLLERIAALPGVTSVSLSQHGVLTGTTNGTNLMRPEGFPEGPDGFPQIRWDVVGPRYFSTIGTRLLTGRDFTDRDSENSPPVIAINAALARLFFRDANPIGRRLLWGVGDTTRTLGIVAVVPDVKQGGAREEPRPQVYLPYLQLPAISPNWILPSTRVLVRTATNPAALASDVRQLILSENARMSVMSVDIGIDLVSRTLVRERMLATLLVTFAALAVGLACLGLYGLIAYQVAQRTSEIGVRMALGAASRDVVWEMARAAFIWIIAGIAIGVPLAVAASRAAQTLLFGLSPTDAGTLVGAVGVMLVLGLVAGYLPARRVARIDPAVALRSE